MKPRVLIMSGLVLVLTLFGSSQVQTTAGQPLAIPQASQPDSLVFTLKIPVLPANSDGDRTAAPSLEGYEASGSPGDPLLPVKAYNIALPPDVIPESVQAQVLQVQTVDLPETYALAPAQPATTWVEQRQVTLWGKNAASILDGKNTQVYQTDAYFPQSQLSEVRFDQLRKWRFVSLLLTPLQYNPVTGKLRLVTEVQIQVTFERLASIDQQKLQIELSDTVMDDRASQLLYNYDQAQAWYPVMAKPAGLSTNPGYVIVTSNAIVTASTRLNSFKAHKIAQGYNVLVVTEDQHGGGPYPSSRVQHIRDWLKANYQTMSIQYVLLIGDPTPWNPDSYFSPVGDVPMALCWPVRRYLDDKGNPAGEQIPTDYLYANLNGNWNLNTLNDGDNWCGELTDDYGTGGVSFQPDVYAGRIPVYQNVSGWAATLDSILNKTILYEDSGDMDWRKRALLPMSFSDLITDSGYLGEAMKSGYLISNGYDVFSIYQHFWYGGACWSKFPSNQSLVPDAVVNQWKNNAYGIVTWHAHGSINSVGIGAGVCANGNLLTSSDASLLDDNRPAIVFSASCNNGWPENPNNLGYALLKNGAVSTISSSRMSGYYDGVFSPSEARVGNADLAYYVTQRVVNNVAVGRALYDEKSQMSLVTNWSNHPGTTVVNLIDFNLYGDPSLSINDGHPVAPTAPDWLITNPNPSAGIDLTWHDNSDNELGFVLERKSDSSPDWSPVFSPVINQTSWSDSGLSCGEHYYYRLHAVNAYGDSAYSNTADAWSLQKDEFENDDIYTQAKSIITAGTGATGQTHSFHTAGDVDWVEFNATWGKLYDIQVTPQAGSNDTYLELYDSTGTGLVTSNNDCTFGDPASGSCLNDWVAPAGGLYYLKVYNAQSQGGCYDYEYYLTVQEGGFASWPAQPTNLTATPISHCQVNLAWTPNSFLELGFEIERFGWQGTAGGYGTVMWSKIATVGTGVTAYSDSGLECSNSYPYRVRAYNANGKSFYSNTATAVTHTADAFEADDSYTTANTIAANGTPQYHNFSADNDQDWVKFSASAGQVYTITTSSLGAANDTVLELYDDNGTTLLELNDDCVELESCIKKWTAPSSGTYFVRVYNYYGNGGCPSYQYTLSLTRTNSSTSLAAPSGLYLNDSSVSTLLLTWADLNPQSTPHDFQIERWHVITGTLGQWRRVGIVGPGLIMRSEPDDAGSSLGSAAPNYAVSTFRDSWLTCNTSYNYRVRGFDALGETAYTEILSATTPLWDTFEPDADPAQAQNIVVNFLNNVDLNHNLGPELDSDWFNFTAAAGEVYTITTSQFTHSDSLTPTLELYQNPLDPLLVTTQQCSGHPGALCINGWTASTSDTYYILVKGEGGCPGHDYFLNVVDSQLSASWPAPPTAFTGTLTLPDTINLTWTDNTPPYDHLGFRLERLMGVGWMQIADLGSNVTSYSDSVLACGQPYQYRLFAYNANGNSAYATPVELSTPACLYPIPGYPLFLPLVRR